MKKITEYTFVFIKFLFIACFLAVFITSIFFLFATTNLNPEYLQTWSFIWRIIVAIVIAVGIIILIREVAVWYWKINKRIDLLEQNNQELKKIEEILVKIENSIRN